MAKQLLFQFWVKPQGFLAKKRYANVFVDNENGQITREDVDGEPSINLPNVDDYKSTNYPYQNDDEVTRFCNTATFTEYIVKASRSDPFAYSQTALNAPQCGYLEPLPTPAVPSNPFGTAPYAVYAFYNYCDILGVDKTVNIYKRNHTGTPIQLTYGGDTPIRKIYDAGDDKLANLRSLEVEFSFIAEVNFQLQNIYTADEREYRLDVVKVATNELEFSGFIIPDNSEEPFDNPPYEVKIRATDGLGPLKTITYPMPVGSSTDIKQKFLYIIAFALSKTNLNLDILTMVNLYSSGMLNGISDDPLEQASVNPLRMSSSDGAIYTCYEALEAVCKQFGASISQVNGQWRFARINELAKGTGRYRLYDFTARYKFSGTLETIRNLGKIGTDIVLLSGGVSTIQPPYKLVKVLQEFGRAPDVIYNGNFEEWDGQNFRYWTRYGAINVSRIQKSIVSSAGTSILIDDYACQFNEKSNAAKWLEGTKTFLNKGQTTTLSLNIGKTDGIYKFKVRFKVGEYYLTNDTGTFEWVSQLATTGILVDNQSADIFTFSISIEIPEAPVSGDLVIQLFGFVKLSQSVSNNSPRPARTESGARDTSNVNYTYTEVDEYEAIAIDNVAITTTLKEDTRLKGILNVSSQNGFYTNKPEQISIIWGEFLPSGLDPVVVRGSNNDPTRPTRDGSAYISGSPVYSEAQSQKQLQTIYNPDNSYSREWYEFGETTAPTTIGLGLAKAILKAYQLPYKRINVSIKGANLGYFDTFNIIVKDQPEFSAKIFSWLSVDFDDKNNTATGTLVEIFSKALISNDYTTPDSGTGGNGEMPILQNPNPPIQLNGIFTEQFTTEFT